MEDIYNGLDWNDKCVMQKLYVESLNIDELTSSYVPEECYNIKETRDMDKYLD
jgi:hypothetical protein